MLKVKTFEKIVPAMALLIIFAVTGAQAWELPARSQEKSRLVLVLLDETDSFGRNTTRGQAETLYWDEALLQIKTIVNALKPGDEFLLIAIDDKGFEEEDVLIPLIQLDRAFLKAKIAKKKLLSQIQGLQRRKTVYHSTDILSALYQAAHQAHMGKNQQTVILCFSDMIQEPKMPGLAESQDLAFPASSEGFFFFVDASGRSEWQGILHTWVPILTRAGLQIGAESSPHFFQFGESKLRLAQILAQW